MKSKRAKVNQELWHQLTRAPILGRRCCKWARRFFSALAATWESSAATHPWVERDPATGARNLKIPLPPPETVKKLADMLSVLADNLRGKPR